MLLTQKTNTGSLGIERGKEGCQTKGSLYHQLYNPEFYLIGARRSLFCCSETFESPFNSIFSFDNSKLPKFFNNQYSSFWVILPYLGNSPHCNLLTLFWLDEPRLENLWIEDFNETFKMFQTLSGPAYYTLKEYFLEKVTTSINFPLILH